MRPAGRPCPSCRTSSSSAVRRLVQRHQGRRLRHRDRRAPRKPSPTSPSPSRSPRDRRHEPRPVHRRHQRSLEDHVTAARRHRVAVRVQHLGRETHRVPDRHKRVRRRRHPNSSAACDTVIAALPAAEPDAAVTVALPTPIAVTRPSRPPPPPACRRRPRHRRARHHLAPLVQHLGRQLRRLPQRGQRRRRGGIPSPTSPPAGAGGGGGGGAVGPSSPQEPDTIAMTTREAPALRRPVSVSRRRRCVCMPPPLEKLYMLDSYIADAC